MLSPPSHKLWFFPAVFKKTHSGHKFFSEPASWFCLLCSVILNLRHSLAWCIFPSPPSVNVTNILCDIFWCRTRGDKRAKSPWRINDNYIPIEQWLFSSLLIASRRLSPLNLPSSLFYFKNYKVILETQITASCNRRPGFLNKRLPHERCWLRCKPSRGVNAWRSAQTAKPRYGACGAALSAVCPYICPSANYPHTYTCSTCTHRHTHTQSGTR